MPVYESELEVGKRFIHEDNLLSVYVLTVLQANLDLIRTFRFDFVAVV